MRRLAIIILSAFALVFGTGAGLPVTDTDLIVDEADILDDKKVAESISSIDRPDVADDVRVAVLTTDEVNNSNYDESVTDRAVAVGGEQMIDDGRLAADIVLITISPETRNLGVYSGDDAPDARDIAHSVISHMRPLAKDGQWNDVASAGAQAYFDSVEESAESGSRSDSTGMSDIAKGGAVLIIGVALFSALLVGLTRWGNRSRMRELKNTYGSDVVRRVLSRWGIINFLPDIILEVIDIPGDVHQAADTMAEMKEGSVGACDVRTIEEMNLFDESIYADFDELGKTTDRAKRLWAEKLFPVVSADLSALKSAPEDARDAGAAKGDTQLIRDAVAGLPSVNEVDESVTSGKVSPRQAVGDVYRAMNRSRRQVREVAQRLARGERLSGGAQSDSEWSFWTVYVAAFSAHQASISSASSGASSFSGGGFSGGSGSF